MGEGEGGKWVVVSTGFQPQSVSSDEENGLR